MNTKIAFADLTYNEKGTSSKAFPYASALVASYAKKKFGDNINGMSLYVNDANLSVLYKNSNKIVVPERGNPVINIC